MFEYPLINYLPQLIFAAVWFFPGLVLGIVYGWRMHVTYVMALDGSLDKEADGLKKPISFLVKKHQTATTATTDDDATPAAPMTDAINKIKASIEATTVPAEEESHKPGEFFW